MRTLAARIRLARRAAGVTQSSLADAVGVSRSSVAQWERDSGSNPAATNLGRLAVALQCSFEWLATGRGSNQATAQRGPEGAEPGVVMSHFARDHAEENLLDLFRQIDAWDKEFVLSLAEKLVKRGAPAARTR